MKQDNLFSINSLAILREIIEALECAYYDIHSSFIYFKEISTKDQDWEKLLKIRIKNQEGFLKDCFNLVGMKWDNIDLLLSFSNKLKDYEDEEELENEELDYD